MGAEKVLKVQKCYIKPALTKELLNLKAGRLIVHNTVFEGKGAIACDQPQLVQLITLSTAGR